MRTPSPPKNLERIDKKRRYIREQPSLGGEEVVEGMAVEEQEEEAQCVEKHTRRLLIRVGLDENSFRSSGIEEREKLISSKRDHYNWIMIYMNDHLVTIIDK